MPLTLLAQGDKIKLVNRCSPGDDGAPGKDGIGYLGARERPGDVKELFTSALAGAAEDAPVVAIGTSAVNADGAVLRVPGAATAQVVAARQDFPAEAGQVYAARAAVRRVQNTSDPLGDTIQFGIACLNAAKQKVSERIFFEGSVVVADGLISRQVTFSRDQQAELTLSDTTRYVRPFVRVFGGDGITDVVVVGTWETSGLPGPKGDTGDLTPMAAAVRDDILIARDNAYQSAATSSADAADARTILDAFSANQGGGGLIFETWALLAADTTPAHLTNGQMATVLATDLGSHTDPVVGGIAPNAGTYRYSTAPAGWKRISSATVSTVPSLVSQTRAQVPLLMTRSNVYIASDEAHGGYATLNYFDGWDLSLIAVLPWLPSVLFANFERGVYYDLTDPTSMFQDRAATVPVAFDNDPIAIALNRAVPRPNTKAARVNLLNATEDMATSKGSPQFGGLVATFDAGYPSPVSGSVAWRFLETAFNMVHTFNTNVTLANATYTYQAKIKLIGRTKVRIGLQGSRYANLDLATMSVTSTSGGAIGYVGSTDANGFTTIGVEAVYGGGFSPIIGVLDDAGANTFMGDVAKGFHLAERQLSVGSGIKPYQAVGSSNMGWIAKNLLSSDTDAQRPKFRKGVKNYATFDGVANALFADAVDLRSSSNAVTFAIALEILEEKLSAPLSHTNTPDSASRGTTEVNLNDVAYGLFGGFFGADGKFVSAGTSPSGARIPRTEVCIVEYNAQAADPLNRMRFMVNGQYVTAEIFRNDGAFTRYAASLIATLSVGARRSNALFAKMNCFAVLAVKRLLTETEKQLLTQNFMLKAGVVPGPTTFAFSHTPTSFIDTHANPVTPGQYPSGIPATFSRVVYTTNANWIRLSGFATRYVTAQ